MNVSPLLFETGSVTAKSAVESSIVDMTMSYVGNSLQTLSLFVIAFLIARIVMKNWSIVGRELRLLLCHLVVFLTFLGAVKLCYVCGWLLSSPPVGTFFIIFAGVTGVALIQHLYWFQQNVVEVQAIMSSVVEKFTKDILPKNKVGLWKRTFTTEDKEEYIEWDATAHEIFGTDPKTFDHTYVEFASLVHPDDLVPMSQALDEAIKNETIFDHKFRITDHNGGWKEIHSRGTVFNDLCGKPIYVAGFNFLT